jgi:predicted peroxiredoxin
MEKLLIVSTHSNDDPERATIPFVLGLTALSQGKDAVILLQIDGVWMARKGFAALVREETFPPALDMLNQFLEAGGRIMVCGPCANKRKLQPTDLIDGVVIVNAPTIVKELGEAHNVVSY